MRHGLQVARVFVKLQLSCVLLNVCVVLGIISDFFACIVVVYQGDVWLVHNERVVEEHDTAHKEDEQRHWLLGQRVQHDPEACDNAERHAARTAVPRIHAAQQVHRQRKRENRRARVLEQSCGLFFCFLETLPKMYRGIC